MELSEKIVTILAEEGFAIISDIEQIGFGMDNLFVAELEAYSLSGEELLYADVVFDGTDTGFVEEFCKLATAFDENEQVKEWMKHIYAGKGAAGQAAFFHRKAKDIKEMLLSLARKLKGEEVELSNEERRRAVLRELFDKVKEALDLEPCGCDDEDEQEIWESINDLSDMLYDYL